MSNGKAGLVSKLMERHVSSAWDRSEVVNLVNGIMTAAGRTNQRKSVDFFAVGWLLGELFTQVELNAFLSQSMTDEE